MGGTLSKPEINGFQHTFSVLSLAHLLRQRGPKCWPCGKSDHVAARLTVQQSKCLPLLSILLWVPRISRGCEGYGVRFKNAARGFHQVLQKLWGSPFGRVPTKFHAEFHEGSTRTVCEVPRARLGPDRPTPRSGPDSDVGPRQLYQAGIA